MRVTVVILLLLSACAAERPGLYRDDGSRAAVGPQEAVVVESRVVEVEDPAANEDNLAIAYNGAMLSAVVANAAADNGAITALALVAGLGAGWLAGELGDQSVPGHAYVVKDKLTGETFTVIQTAPPNDWLLPPGTSVLVVNQDRQARVIPDSLAAPAPTIEWETPRLTPQPPAPSDGAAQDTDDPGLWREPTAP